MSQAALAGNRRSEVREKRRRELVAATMKCIARKGIGNTTLADVANEAGLSQGIVNLHFDTKENLLNETLRALADEYKAQFEKALVRSGPAAADKLRALVELEFRPLICEPAKLAVWFAFWGEVKSRPTYRQICDETDRYYDEVVEKLCQAIIDEGGYEGVSAELVTEGLTAMSTGLWLDCLVSPSTWDRHYALETVMTYLKNIFPKHYG